MNSKSDRRELRETGRNGEAPSTRVPPRRADLEKAGLISEDSTKTCSYMKAILVPIEGRQKNNISKERS